MPVAVPRTETSFFFDVTLEEDIVIEPSQPSAALIGSRQQCSVTLEAPFKRIFFYIAVSLSLIVVVFIIVRAFIRLSSPTSDSPADPSRVVDDA